MRTIGRPHQVPPDHQLFLLPQSFDEDIALLESHRDSGEASLRHLAERDPEWIGRTQFLRDLKRHRGRGR